MLPRSDGNMSDNRLFNVEAMWREWFMNSATAMENRFTRFMHWLPSDPRCKFCHAPFQGVGGHFVRTVYGKRQSILNPSFCNICEEFARKNPGGAEVDMSMLFVDVRGSTAMSERMSPSEFQKLINRFYIEATRVINKEDGLVEKLAGDSVAAFWGAGFAGVDYVKRTLTTALTLLNAMEEQDIQVGIGVHAGVAFFGGMGTANGLVEISAIGDEVNTAARLASKAAAGEIIVSEKALQKAGIDAGNLEARSLELKGIREPVHVRVMRAAR